MGLYYNPIPPHIGAQQPLTPIKLTPPQSGPPVNNPPLTGARIAQAILSAWIAAAPAPVLARNFIAPPPPASAPTFKPYLYATHDAWLPKPPLPTLQSFVDPPISGPPIDNPPVRGTRFAFENAWPTAPITPEPNFKPDVFAPWAAAGVVPYLPIGTRAPQSVLDAWRPPAPMPITPVFVDPPISGPSAYTPIGSRVPQNVLNAWLPLPPSVYPDLLPNNFAPWTLPPPVVSYTPIGARIPVAVQVAWLPPQPQPQTVRIRPPLSGPAPQNPRFPGARVPVAVQVSWLPPPPRPPAVVNLSIATVPITGVLAATETADTAQILVEVRSDAPGVLNFGRRVTINRW